MKPTIRYMCHEMKKSVIVLYVVLVAVYIASYILNTTLNDVYISMNGSVSSLIFAFIAGIVVIKEPLLMTLQNGVSRKTYWLSTMATFGLISLVMAVAETFFTTIGEVVGSETFQIESLHSMVYSKRVVDLHWFQEGIESFLLIFVLTLMFFVAGYFIGTLFYRMSKSIRMIVSIGTPVLLFFVLPLVESALTKGKIMKFLGKFLLAAIGYKTQNPYTFMGSGILLSIVMVAISWVLIRRVVEKKE